MSYRGIGALSGLLLAVSAYFTTATAQPDPLPENPSIGANGVNLLTGAINVPGPSVTIGQQGAGGLTYELNYVGARIGAAVPFGWRSNWGGTISRIGNGTTYYVSLENSSDRFSYSGGAFTSADGSGATLIYNASSELYTYTSSQGVVAVFDDDIGGNENTYNHTPTEAVLVSVTKPSGETTTLTYDTACMIFEPELGGCIKRAVRLQSIANNFGYLIHLDYLSDDESQNEAPDEWSMLAQVTALNLTVDYCAPYASDCTGLTRSWPKFSLVLTADGQIASAIDSLGLTTNFTYDPGTAKLAGVRLPGRTTDTMSITWNAQNRVQSVSYAGSGTWGYTYSDNVPASGERTTTVTNPYAGVSVAISSFAAGRVRSVKDELNRETQFEYDAQGRTIKVTLPDGVLSPSDPNDSTIQYAYDNRGNLISETRFPKLGSPLAPIVSSWSYDSSCTNIKTCNKPNAATDERGFRTEFTYNATHGGIETETRPAPTGVAPTGFGIRPQTRAVYQQFQARFKDSATSFTNGSGIWLQVATSRCITSANCTGTADEATTTAMYPTAAVPNNLQATYVSSRAGDGSVVSTSGFTYDEVGNLTAVDGPLAGPDDTTRTVYDVGRRVVGVIGADPDGGGPLKFRAQRVQYNNYGLPSTSSQGTVSSAGDTTFSTFVALTSAEKRYDVLGRVIQRSGLDGGGSSLFAVTQYSFDLAGRMECTAVRMNSVVFGSLPTSACSLGTPGAFGHDRVVKTVYNLAGQPTVTKSALGTSLAQDNVVTTYNANNGILESVKDAKNNLTTYEHDGFYRLTKTRYPVPTVGANLSSTTDYEESVYGDAISVRGLLIQQRRRDGTQFNLTYDNLQRLTARDAPGAQPDVTLAYDLLGRRTSATQAGHSISYAFDQISRLLSETGPLGTIAYQWDAAGRRTRITWPGGGYFVDYDYDLAGAMTRVRENGATSGIGILATYAYDDLGRRTSLTRGNGVVSTLGYDAGSRLATYSHDASGTVNDQTYSFSYNPASQIITQTSTNSLFDLTNNGNFSNSYTVDGLNKYLTAAGISIAHDGRGNLTGDGSKTYAYDADNRLTSVSGGASATLSYDPAGRLFEVASSATTRFLYDGGEAIAEYSGTNVLLRRYVPGAETDETLVWLEGAGTTDRRWLMTDARGSVIGISNASGAVTNINKYDSFGTPAPSNVGRFQYTGQMWLAEIGIYHYKARMYHASLGRFMQTDPIGYSDGMNLYAYVANDPINHVDPSGMSRVCFRTSHWISNLRYNHSRGVWTGGWTEVTSTQCFNASHAGGGGGEGGGGGGRGRLHHVNASPNLGLLVGPQVVLVSEKKDDETQRKCEDQARLAGAAAASGAASAGAACTRIPNAPAAGVCMVVVGGLGYWITEVAADREYQQCMSREAMLARGCKVATSRPDPSKPAEEVWECPPQDGLRD